MHCGRVQNLLSAFIDRELTGADMLSIRAHVGECEECARELEAIRRIKAMLGSLDAPRVPVTPCEARTSAWRYTFLGRQAFLLSSLLFSARQSVRERGAEVHDALIRPVARKTAWWSVGTALGAAALFLMLARSVSRPSMPDAVHAHLAGVVVPLQPDGSRLDPSPIERLVLPPGMLEAEPGYAVSATGRPVSYSRPPEVWTPVGVWAARPRSVGYLLIDPAMGRRTSRKTSVMPTETIPEASFPLTAPY